MLKKVLSCILAAALIVASVPMNGFAQERNVPFGDVNLDGKVDLNDVLMMKRHIEGGEGVPALSQNAADIDHDGDIDTDDILRLKQYLAEWNIDLGVGLFAVSFYDGDRLLDTLVGIEGEPLGAVPATEKVSKANAVFAGWYLDEGFTQPFYADAPVTADTKVYAKYDVLDGSTLTVTSFAQMDMNADARFTAVGSGDTGAIVLTPKDGSDPVKLNITGSNPYTITAEGGFKEGASYELTLPDGLNFVGSNGETMPDTIRTASFNIDKAAVDNLKMSDAVRYVKVADTSVLQAGGTVAFTEVPDGTLTGTKKGDLICFYKETNPKDRNYKDNAYMDDPETWFTVGSVDETGVTLEAFDMNDQEMLNELYEIPDNFPVTGAIPVGENGTLTLAMDETDSYALDEALYAQMVEVGEGESANLAYAQSKLSVGDFVSIYTSSDDIDAESDIYFGKITAIGADSTITYEKSSAEEIRESMDLYVQPVLEGEDLLSEETKQEIEAAVLSQIEESGFAEEAGFLLAELAAQTDGFRNMEGVQALLTDENGEPLSEDEIALLNIGKSFELADDVELKVEIITEGDQLHFQDKGAVQLGIGVDAKFEVDGKDGKIVIDLSAVFVQELAIGITASGELVKKEILFIPIPIGVKLGSAIDLMSYTGIRVDAHAYTVAEKDQSFWEQLQNAVKNPKKIADVLPDSSKFDKIKKGLETVGDVYDKIDEVRGKIEQVRKDAEKVESYTEDLTMLWEMVDEMNLDGMPNEEEWETIGQTLGKTNISKDLMDMLDLSTETELDAERYTEGLTGLLTKYSEMLEKETDWVQLVEQEICSAEINIKGLIIYLSADFVVRTDMNIVMGTSLQYQVGKRYSFWVKIGLFKPKAGSSTMDLVDEEFAFQFYVMGKIGLRMGVKATAGLALGSKDLARVGISLEVGPYVKLYGFFIYEYERSREANTAVWVSNEQMAGALYLDFGLYLILSVEAAALGDLFEVEYEFFDKEYPLLEMGTKKYPYAFQYKAMEDEAVLVEDEDDNFNTGVTMQLPDEYLAVSWCNLTTGKTGAEIFGWDHFNVSLSNPAFSVDGNGKISVDVPENTRYMKCDMTLTYKYSKLAFSQYDMQVTIPLVWTNLDNAELNQYYTASVRVGNHVDGYDIVWSKRVRKNEEFTLPTEDEIRELIGYQENDSRYASFSAFPEAGQTKAIYHNLTYDCEVVYRDYTITVNGIQNADGTTRSETFRTVYGGTFDFSSLADTGTNKPGNPPGMPDGDEKAEYTKFAGVMTEATITVSDEPQTIDFGQPVTGKTAEVLLAGGVSATAEYVDDSVLVTYTFTGIEEPDHEERIRKGAIPKFDVVGAVKKYPGMTVKSVTPELDSKPVNTNITYYVECSRIKGENYTITFEENGGSTVEDISREGGSAIGNLPQPTRTGHVFEGWYADSSLTTPFTDTNMPLQNITLYAKWKEVESAVTLNVNGGTSWGEGAGTVTVSYGSTYGELPAPAWDDRHAFLGWFTAAEGGTQITADTVVTELGDHTLYAHWNVLLTVEDTITITAVDPVIYDSASHAAIITDYPTDSEGNELPGFIVEYQRKDTGEYIEGEPIDAGIYHVRVSRPADNTYAYYEKYQQDAVTINKAPFTVDDLTQDDFEFINDHFSGFTIRLNENGWTKIHTDHRKTEVRYVYLERSADYAYHKAFENTDGVFKYIIPEVKPTDGTNVTNGVSVYISDSNYTGGNDAGASYEGHPYVFKPEFSVTAFAPEENWAAMANREPFTVTDNAFTITTPGQLGYLAYALYDETLAPQYNSSEITYTLGGDLDMSGHIWNREIGYDSTKAFKATFDGAGHTISGLYRTGKVSVSSLFGYVTGTVKNLNIEKSYFYITAPTGTEERYCGGIAAVVDQGGRIENCTVDATVYGGGNRTSYIGGIVGYLRWGTVTGCINKGYICSGRDGRAGGIAGAAGVYGEGMSVISGCTNVGTVRVTDDYGGAYGILGYRIQDNAVELKDNIFDQGIPDKDEWKAN